MALSSSPQRRLPSAESATNTHTRVYEWADIAERLSKIRNLKRNDAAFFFRHGETTYNAENRITGQHDPMLTEAGKVQARALSELIPDNVSFVVVSRLRRATQTCFEAFRGHAVPSRIYTDSRLNEVSLGALEGEPRIHLPQFEAGDIDFAPPYGESYRAAAQRVFSFVVDLFEYCSTFARPQVSVIFCHAGVLRILASSALPVSSSAEMFSMELKNAEGILLQSELLHIAHFWFGDEIKSTNRDPGRNWPV